MFFFSNKNIHIHTYIDKSKLLISKNYIYFRKHVSVCRIYAFKNNLNVFHDMFNKLLLINFDFLHNYATWKIH